MANIPAELRALPLEHVIGSPLVAAIKAQALAANTTVDFIKEVGLKPRALETGENEDELDEVSGESGKPGFEARYVDFKFDRVLEEEVVIPGTPPTKTTKYSVVPSKLTVPLLSMVPIPYIRINDMTIDFEFQIKDVETRESKTEKKVSMKSKVGNWFFKVNVKGSYCNRTANKRETDRRTTLRITVNAVQDQVPEGLGRILDMLNESIRVVPIGQAVEIPNVTTGAGVTP